jgi:hypothetical protein
MENDFKPRAWCWVGNGPRPQCRGTAARSLHGARPKRLGLLGPARGRRGLAGSCADRRNAHSGRSHRAHGPRGGVAGRSSPMDGKRRGLWVEHRGETDDLAGNRKGAGDHR